MNQEQIDRTEMARVLDASVMEKVFGREVLGEVLVLPDPEYIGYYIPNYVPDEENHFSLYRPVVLHDWDDEIGCPCSFYLLEEYLEEDFKPVKYFGHYPTCLEIVPSFTSSPDDALDILYHFLDRNVFANLSMSKDPIERHSCELIGYGGEKVRWLSRGYGDIFGEAVCRAAIDAADLLELDVSS